MKRITGLYPLWAALLLVLLAVVAFRTVSDLPPRAEPAEAVAHKSPEQPSTLPMLHAPSALPPKFESAVSGGPPDAGAEPALAARLRIAQTHELVAEYLAIADVRERGDLARSIASIDDDESLAEITALYHRSRHPAEREALVAAIGDTDLTSQLDGKLSLLASAFTGQPRNVRNTALGVASQIDDQRAVTLIKRMARNDPDKEMRDAAKAVLGAE